MPGHYPASTYPFALQCFVFFGAVFSTIFKDRWMSLDKQMTIFFGIQALLLALVPVFALIGGTKGYWLVFLTLMIDGWFSGLCQTFCYEENAKLPGNYIGIFLTSQGLAGIASNLLRFASL